MHDYEAYEEEASAAYQIPVQILVGMEQDDGIPWPVSGDATTIRAGR